MTVKEAMEEIRAAENLAKFLDKLAEGATDEREEYSLGRAAMMLQTYAAMIKEMQVVRG